MKKLGFTLAEVLITLAIIGVVAALTLPNLTADTAAAKIGPRLGKAVSSFELANMSLLNANSVDSITDLDIGTDDQYVQALSDYLIGTVVNETITTKDNVAYTVAITTAATSSTKPPHKVYRGIVTIDINPSNNANIDGTDTFYFGLYDDGSLKPKGQKGWNGSDTDDWTTKCPVNATPTAPSYCAGHIFANNMKVLYR